jgi:hypothetical protein
MKKIYYYIIPIIIVLFVGVLIYGNSITNNVVSEPDPLIMKGSDSVDFDNKEEGTIVFNGNFNPELIGLKIENLPPYIIIFESKKLNGIKLKYNFQEKTIEGGNPLIKSQPINLLDENLHEIAYSFKKGVGQKIFVDGAQVATSEYEEPKQVTVTSFVSYSANELDETQIQHDMQIENNARGFEDN